MSKHNNLPHPHPFSWAVGIEDTFIPHARPGLRPLEEYQLMQHYTQWREDLQRAASLGVKKIRWGVPWYRVEAVQGQYDWTWIDEVLPYMINTLGLDPIIDLVHYGTPLWMTDSFVDSRYVDSVTAFQSAFAARYKGLVKFYTLLNEPTVTAEFCGLRGQWPPYLTGDAGFVKVMLQLARGIQSCMHAVATVDNTAVFVAVEAMHHYRSLSQAAEQGARRAFLADVLCFDLVQGRVDTNHGMHAWLLQNGATADEVAALRVKPAFYDVFGVNFYPWSAFNVTANGDGNLQLQPTFADGRLLSDVIRACHEYTQLPIFVTETSADSYRRQTWLNETTEAVRSCVNDGLPVIGYAWFPLYSMIEWGYRTTADSVGNHLLHLGLWDVALENGIMQRKESPIAQSYRDVINKSSSQLPSSKGFWPRFCSQLRSVFSKWSA